MYKGVKDIIKEFKEDFDEKSKSIKKAKALLKEKGETADRKSIEEYSLKIIREWDDYRVKSEEFHKKLCSDEISSNPAVILEGRGAHDLNKIDLMDKSLVNLDSNKVYLEKLLFSNKYKIIGYADRVNVSHGTINITDNKLLKKLNYTSSYKLSNGMFAKGAVMKPPLEHLDSCNYIDACLQLSLYMYMAWESNKSLKVGSLFIRYIVLNDFGNKVSDELIEVPYMRSEVKSILKYRLENES